MFGQRAEKGLAAMDRPLAQERSDDGTADGAAASNPDVMDRVHVEGEGPAVVSRISLRDGRERFTVHFPNGEQRRVAREQILIHEAPPLGSPRPTSLAQLASPGAAPRRLEYLGRAFDDASRTIRTPSATFSLVATMVGGGVLSLPYAMSQCGVILGTMVLCGSALTSGWTLNMLVDCARATGLDAFELVGHAAFGERCRKLSVGLVFVICWLTLIAYFVLLADLLTPVAEVVLPGLEVGRGENAIRRMVVSVAAVLVGPMCFKSSLSALKFLCFASVASVLVVGVVVGIRAVQNEGVEHPVQVVLPSHKTEIVSMLVHLELWPKDWWKALYVFPMFGVSFLCHFNALPTHQELQRPTRQRMRRVIGLCLGLTTILYLCVGLSGYIFAGHCTCGNILLNFEKDDGLVVFARAALGLVLILNFPLICQPCRSAFFRVLLMAWKGRPTEQADGPPQAQAAAAVTPSSLRSISSSIWMEETTMDQAFLPPAAAPPPPPEEQVQQTATVESSERTPTQPRIASEGAGLGALASPRSEARVHAYRREDARGMMPSGETIQAVDTFSPKDEVVQQSAVEPTPLQRCVLTVVLLISSLLVSMCASSILVVWSILGSTVSFLIGFILPAAFWRRLVGSHVQPWRRRAAEALFVTFTMLAVACTVLTCLNLNAPPCPTDGIA